jgi:hypothetical protein
MNANITLSNKQVASVPGNLPVGEQIGSAADLASPRLFRDCFRDRWPAKRNRKIYGMPSVAASPVFNIGESFARFDFSDCDSSETF